MFDDHTYDLIAEALSAALWKADRDEYVTLRRLVLDFAELLELDNPDFNFTRFLRACGIIGAAVRERRSA